METITDVGKQLKDKVAVKVTKVAKANMAWFGAAYIIESLFPGAINRGVDPMRI